MRKQIVLALVMGLLAMLTAPDAVFAADSSEQQITGTLNNYTAPEVLAIAVENMDSIVVTSLDPQTNYRFVVTVRDNNTLSDIENILLELYLDNRDLPDSRRNDYRFLFRASDNSWSELGPDTDNRHIVAVSCVHPSNLTQTTDNYVFVVKFDVIAQPTTGTQWDAYAKATDDNGLTGELTATDKFAVNDYVSLTVSVSNLIFNGSPGQDNVEPTVQPTVATVDANVGFKIHCKVDDWEGTVDNTKIIGAENTKAAQTATHDNEIILRTTYYDNLWSNVNYGEDVARNIYWFLNIPGSASDPSYTTIFYVKALKEQD
jgi:hypothetical protein